MKRLSILVILLANLLTAQGVENNKITICWDTSFSMLSRDMEKEFEILEKIFKRNPDQTVQLLLFDIAIEEKVFQINDGDWSELKNTLTSVVPDGATVYEGLAAKIANKTVYFFTDGNALVPDEVLPVKKGNYVISSALDRNEEFLKKSALVGRGRLMDFAAILPDNIKATAAAKELPNKKEITGTVYIDNVPTNDIEIRIIGSNKIIKTDSSGKFSLPAVPGDSILITSRANKTMKTVPIGYFNKSLDVFLKANVTTLDEVVVTEQRVNAISEDLVNTGNGLKSKEEIGYAVQSIDSEDITPIQTDIRQSVQGRFSGVNLGPGEDLTQVTMRTNATILGNNYGLIVIDGVPMEQNDSSFGSSSNAASSFVNPDNVADITVLKGYAATNRYGSAGNNGVILITTKTASYGGGTGGTKNTALAQNNVYDPEAKITNTKSALTKALEAYTDMDKAYGKYLTLRNFNENNDSFYLDAFEFFKDKDRKLAARVISNLWEKNIDKESYLRLVALSLRYLGDYDAVQILNNRLNTAKPTALQPFFTEAKLQLEQKEYQAALDRLITLANGGAYGTMEVSPISKSLERELKNLIFQKRDVLDVTKVAEPYFKNTQMNVRLLVEWSNAKTEFNVQFVNPQNRYFNWEHTSAANSGRIEEEVSLGYAMEEFELYDDLKGNWKINADFLGNLDRDNSEPLVLLCSVYTNFGYPSQTKKLVWLYLDGQNPKKEIIALKI